VTSPLFSTTPRTRSGSSSSIRDVLLEATGYWERRRLWYNAALALIATGWVMLTWLDFPWGFTYESASRLLRLAALANVCYCAAYLVDVPLSRSSFKAAWQQRRGTLWLVGTVFATLVVFYWIAHEIDPYVR
jgi:hypothetical protein